MRNTKKIKMGDTIHIPRVKLGSQGLEVSNFCPSLNFHTSLFLRIIDNIYCCFQVSKLGYGCMGLTGVYNAAVPEDVAISLIKHAFSKGITFFDTADFYAAHTNEVFVGKVLLSFTYLFYFIMF